MPHSSCLCLEFQIGRAQQCPWGATHAKRGSIFVAWRAFKHFFGATRQKFSPLSPKPSYDLSGKGMLTDIKFELLCFKLVALPAVLFL